MQSIARDNILNTWSVRIANSTLPNQNTLVNVLEDGLKRNFEHVYVRWVDCPDLSQEPFNLAASGLCGQTVYIEIGDKLCLEPVPMNRQIFPIKEIISFFNCDSRNSFIFGNGVTGKCDQLILNASFSPTTNGVMEIENRSRIVFVRLAKRTCKLRILPDNELNCSRLGTFFLCEGLRGSVLEVRAKKYRSTDLHPLPGFIDSMRDALIKEFGITDPVVLGGSYVVNNALWKHELVRHSWEPFFENRIIKRRYCNINVPETIISTFNSSATGYLLNLEHPPIKLTCQSTQSLSHHNGIGRYYFKEATNYGIEYLGYFCPAEMVYRFDDPSIERPNLR